MKIKLWILAFVFAFSLSAEEENFEHEESCPTTWAFSTEFLWWTPCSERLAYTAEKKGPDSYSIHEITPGGTAGVRLMLRIEKLFCDRDLMLSWTHLSANEKTETESKPVFLPLNATSTDTLYSEIEGTWALRYNDFRALAGYDLLQNEYYHVKSLFGATGIWMKERLRSYFCGHSPYSIKMRQQHTAALGATLGCSASYRLSEDFDCLISGSGSLLASWASAHEDNDVEIEWKMDRRMISGYDIAVLLRYDTSLLNKDLLLQIGYQFLQWHNIPHNSFNASLQQIASSKTIGFRGFIFGADLSF